MYHHNILWCLYKCIIIIYYNVYINVSSNVYHYSIRLIYTNIDLYRIKQTYSREFINETILLSDLFKLNEISAANLLITGFKVITAISYNKNKSKSNTWHDMQCIIYLFFICRYIFQNNIIITNKWKIYMYLTPRPFVHDLTSLSMSYFFTQLPHFIIYNTHRNSIDIYSILSSIYIYSTFISN